MAQRRSSDHRAPAAIRNHLLAALPAYDRAELRSRLSLSSLRHDMVLHKPGDAVERVYFLTSGFCSLVNVLQTGRMVEVATIGREGMVGLPAMVEGSTWSTLTMVQGECENCYSMSAVAFREELDRRGAFYRLVVAYAQAFSSVVMQSTACNAVHSIERRLARWLLHAHDRMERDDFPLTQEFVAMMLGASRPMVSIVAGTLQKAGLIAYQRARVTIADRRRLERVSCECYTAVREVLAPLAYAAHAQIGSAVRILAPRKTPILEQPEYRCLACGELLMLTDRVRTSASKFVLTESYACVACNAAYIFTPSTGWWKSVREE
jgi:CRP-like cAMP-binding protein